VFCFRACAAQQGLGLAKEKLPRKFGKYILLEKVATGGMAEIFRSKNVGAAGFEREIAIKRILPHFTEDENFVRMFIDEATIAAKLHHANIVQIFDFDQVEETYFIAMEYVEGKDLKQTMKKSRKSASPIGVWQAVYIAMEVAKALQYAHSRTHKGRPLNIVHRDVSPQNVMVSFSGEVKIMDFGIAKAAERSTKTRAGTVKGKCAYMSPEQARGKPLDQRSDLFALGIIMWELLTRKRLFAGETDFETLSNVLKCSVEPASAFNPKVTPELDEILAKILVKNANDRYADCGMLHRELSRLYYSNVDNVEDVSTSVMMQSLFADEIQAIQEAAKEERSDIIQDLIREDSSSSSAMIGNEDETLDGSFTAEDLLRYKPVPAIGDGVDAPDLADQDLQETMPLSDMQEEIFERLKINPKAARENRVAAPVAPRPAASRINPVTGTFTGVHPRRSMTPMTALLLSVGVVGIVLAFAFFRSERGGTQAHPAGEISQQAQTVKTPRIEKSPAPAPPLSGYTLSFVVHPANIGAILYLNGLPFHQDQLSGLKKNQQIKVYAEAQGVRSQEIDVLVSRKRQTVELVIPVDRDQPEAKELEAPIEVLEPENRYATVTAPGATIWVGDNPMGKEEARLEGQENEEIEIIADFGGGRTVARSIIIGIDDQVTILPPAITLGSFIIRPTPSNAQVEVNGKVFKTQEGIAEASELDVGKLHRIRVFAEGYETSEQTLTLDAQEQSIDVALKAIKKAAPPKKAISPAPAKQKYGYLTINAIPWAEVYYKGKKLKLTPIRKKKFPAGKISLVLKHPSNKKTVNITLKPGEHKVLPPTRMLPK